MPDASAAPAGAENQPPAAMPAAPEFQFAAWQEESTSKRDGRVYKNEKFGFQFQRGVKTPALLLAMVSFNYDAKPPSLPLTSPFVGGTFDRQGGYIKGAVLVGNRGEGNMQLAISPADLDKAPYFGDLNFFMKEAEAAIKTHLPQFADCTFGIGDTRVMGNVKLGRSDLGKPQLEMHPTVQYDQANLHLLRMQPEWASISLYWTQPKEGQNFWSAICEDADDAELKLAFAVNVLRRGFDYANSEYSKVA